MSMNPIHHSQPPESYTSPPVTIILTVLLLVFFFIGFFSIYFCRCFMQNLLYTWHLRHSPSGTSVGPAGTGGGQGLDPSIIKSFPTFMYSSVKDFRREKYGLECAICLCEFEDDNILRLLTPCCHVYHQECIDLWLESHKSCPVCRRSLDTPMKSPEKSPISVNNAMHDIDENESLDDTFSVAITIKDGNTEERERSGEGDRVACDTTEQSEGYNMVERFSRSHSTGHSIVRSREEEEDRFTLRLPEHVKAKLLRGHNLTKSCTTFGEFKSKTTIGNGGFGEVSELSGGDMNKV